MCWAAAARNTLTPTPANPHPRSPWQGFGCTVLATDVAPDPALAAAGVTYCALPELLSACDVVSLHVPLLHATRHMINAETCEHDGGGGARSSLRSLSLSLQRREGSRAARAGGSVGGITLFFKRASPPAPPTRSKRPAPSLQQFKQGAMLVNVSRGGLIDTEAVLDALDSGRIGSLALDVYEHEGDLFFSDLGDLPFTQRRHTWDRQFQLLQSYPNVLITPHQGGRRRGRGWSAAGGGVTVSWRGRPREPHTPAQKPPPQPF